MLNTKCFQCGKMFHVCSSCSTSFEWEHKYCCESCWKSSNEYNTTIEEFQKFIDTLTVEQRNYLKKNFIKSDSAEFEFDFVEILRKKEKKEIVQEAGLWSLRVLEKTDAVLGKKYEREPFSVDADVKEKNN